MEQFILKDDIKVFCVTAESFPDGVLAAHQALHRMVAFTNERNYFGLSRMENGGSIVYKAAAEEYMDGEFSGKGLEELIISKGTYQCITVENFMQNVPEIGQAFQKLLDDQNLANEGYCVEWYLPNDAVRCMVRLNTSL